jgi:hypothetical protein
MGRAFRLVLALPAVVAWLGAAPPERPTPAPTPGLPQILEIRLSPTFVRSGSTVHAEVRTTPEVVGVVAIAAGREVVVPEVRTGMFVGNTRRSSTAPTRSRSARTTRAAT